MLLDDPIDQRIAERPSLCLEVVHPAQQPQIPKHRRAALRDGIDVIDLAAVP